MSPDAVQARIQAAIDRLVADGTEVGLQVAVFREGLQVVDAVSGRADPASGRRVTTETLFFAASTAKGVASALVHALVERGEIGYDLHLADVWPQFGRHGKDDVTLRHVLLHTAGVPAPPYATTVEDLCDWDRMCEELAAARPWWTPGSRFGYHAVTFGFLAGEVVRRATGRRLSDWLRELLAPLGVEDDVHFGVPPAMLDRVAHQVPSSEPLPEPLPGTPFDRALPPGIRPDSRYANRHDVLASDIPSQGTMTAKGVATLYAAMVGPVDSERLVSPGRLAALAEVQFEDVDRVVGIPSAWAFGFSPHRPAGVAFRPGSCFGMVGMNGSAAYGDIDSQIAVAVMRNTFDTDMTAAATVDRIVADAFPPTGRRRHFPGS